MSHGNKWWDEWFLNMAKHIATASKDPSTRVGAIITNGNELVSTGYNGLPKGIEDTSERLNNRTLKYDMVVHAEINALIFARRPISGYTIYTYPFAPCSRCTAILINSGIKRFVFQKASQDILERWGPNLQISIAMMHEVGAEVVEMDLLNLPMPKGQKWCCAECSIEMDRNEVFCDKCERVWNKSKN